MNIERLNKLADHLIIGQLGHREFNILSWNKYSDELDDCELDEDCQGSECGYSGCAIGECPIVFPEDWKFYEGEPKTGYRGYPDEHGMDYFDISKEEFDFLFRSNSYNWPTAVLSETITAKEVGLHIREFIQKGGIYEYRASN